MPVVLELTVDVDASLTAGDVELCGLGITVEDVRTLSELEVESDWMSLTTDETVDNDTFGEESVVVSKEDG